MSPTLCMHCSTQLADAVGKPPTVVFVGSAPLVDGMTRLGGTGYNPDGLPFRLAALLPWSGQAAAAKVLSLVSELFERKSSDDLLYSFLVCTF